MNPKDGLRRTLTLFQKHRFEVNLSISTYDLLAGKWQWGTSGVQLNALE